MQIRLKIPDGGLWKGPGRIHPIETHCFESSFNLTERSLPHHQISPDIQQDSPDSGLDTFFTQTAAVQLTMTV